jgi:addiction module HigA family antidote
VALRRDLKQRQFTTLHRHYARGIIMTTELAPVHPGEILREGFLAPIHLSPEALAHAIGMAPARIERLAREQAPVTADTALRLARYFGTSARFWMGLQAQHDLEQAELRFTGRCA